MKTFLSGCCAGLLIGIGGIAFLGLKATNPIAATFFFCFGLYFIISKKFSLYTGKIGYCIGEKPSYFSRVLIPTLIGNIAGTWVCSVLSRPSKNFQIIQDVAAATMESKVAAGWPSAFFLAVFCGIVMYLTVDVAKNSSDMERVFAVVMGVMVFILCGFNHSIADSFYFFMAQPEISVLPSYLFYLLVVIIGNFIGGISIPFIEKISKEGE